MVGFLSDSDDDKAVEEVLSQAKDMAVLEQVAAINCAGINDSDLPSHLETRFQKLKSFPSAVTKPTSLSSKSFNFSDSSQFKNSDDSVKKAGLGDENSEKNENVEKKLGDCEKGLSSSPCLKKCSREKSWLSPSKSFDSVSFSPFRKYPSGNSGKKDRKSSPSFSWDDLSDRSVSPPAKSGCFLCSPKKTPSRKNSKENRGLDLGLDWGKHDEFLSDLSNFSSKSQKKMIKKAMEEEEKVCREAEKIVKWAKQASARMDVSDIEDELSDNENHKYV